MVSKLFKEINTLLGEYQTRDIQIISGLMYNQYKVLKMAEFYSNSRYQGDAAAQGINKDTMGRDMPFFNIVNYRVTLAKVATDLDIKDVNIGSDDPMHYVHSMLLQKEAYEWMKATNFDIFLNDMGQKRAKYGGVLVKRWFDKDDDGEEQLHIEALDWRNVATDQVSIIDNAITETHYYGPSQLMKKDGVWDNVRETIEAAQKTRTKGSKYGLKDEQHNTDKIVIREVTGEFPRSYFLDFNNEAIADDDDWKYSLQHYFVADINGKEFRLFSEELKQADFQYKYLAWEEMPGRALGRGVIEDAEEAQVWTNDAVVNEKNAMDLAGKVVLKTSSKTVGSNILEVDNGRIFQLEDGKDIDAVQLAPAGLGEFQNQVTRWQNQANDATSSYDANSGKQPPADTPYSQTALLNQVAAKPFDYRRQEAGILVTDIFEDWVIPFLVKKLYNGHLLATDFTDEELETIDTAFSTYQVNQKVIPLIMDNKIVTNEQYQAAIVAMKATMKGKRRFLQIPDGFFNDINAKVTVMTTGEQKNKAAILQSLSTILGEVGQSYSPQTGQFALLQNPVTARIFGTILELSGAGISPASLGIGGNTAQTPATPPTQPAQAPQAPQQAALSPAQPQPGEAVNM
jgi:hypothetical protein